MIKRSLCLCKLSKVFQQTYLKNNIDFRFTVTLKLQGILILRKKKNFEIKNYKEFLNKKKMKSLRVKKIRKIKLILEQ